MKDLIERQEESAIRVDTSAWDRSHSGKPKKFGLWMFSIGKNPIDRDHDVRGDYVFTSNVGLKYSEAVKLAKAEAKKRKKDNIWVMA